MKVLIDDFRDVPDAIICRTFDLAMKFLGMFFAEIDYLMLDNDLGETDPKKDGYAIACWIEQRANELGPIALPKTVEIVTGNSVALAKMTQLFGKLYPYNRGRKFSKEPL